MPRYFDVDEANALLPRIVPQVEQLMAAWRVLDASKALVAEAIERHPYGDLGGGELGDAAAASLRVQSALMVLHAQGVVVRHPATGLLDFPSLRDGRLVYLCWRHGEARVAHWHPPEAGFRGRRPIDPE